MLEETQIKHIIEAALMAADGPLTVAQIGQIFAPGDLAEENASKQIRDAIKVLQTETEARGVELKRVASGYRFQVKQDLSPWVSRLWDEKPPRYTRALLETLALVAYKQPVTRGDIEQVRGVSVSQNIMRTLIEREWIKVVGQKEVPGRPSLYGTTKAFLDYFNLKSLDELPPLPEIRQLIEPVLEAEAAPEGGATDGADGTTASGQADEVADVASTNLEVANIAIDTGSDTDQSQADEETDAEAEGSGETTAEVVPLHPNN